MQDCSNSSALAMVLLQSCTKPSIYCFCDFFVVLFNICSWRNSLWKDATCMYFCPCSGMWSDSCFPDVVTGQGWAGATGTGTHRQETSTLQDGQGEWYVICREPTIREKSGKSWKMWKKSPWYGKIMEFHFLGKIMEKSWKFEFRKRKFVSIRTSMPVLPYRPWLN